MEEKLVKVRIRAGMQIQVRLPDQAQATDFAAPQDKSKEVEIPESQVRFWLHALEAIPDTKPTK